MTIYIFLDGRKRLAPPNIDSRSGAAKTGFRPVSTVFDGVLRSSTTPIAAEHTRGHCGPKCDRTQLDAIIRCRQALISGRPRHAVSARSFDDLAGEAEAANAR